jgi:hypothetical protein
MKTKADSAKIFISALVFAVASLLPPASGRAWETFDGAISGATLTILEKLSYQGKLCDKKLAVLGFINASTNTGCKDLSLLLANRITSELDRYRPIAREKYEIVSRHNLDAIETEYVISQKGGKSDVDVLTDLMETSDILITGTWQDAQGSFDLTINALELKRAGGEKGARIVASVSKRITKSGLSKKILLCLEGPQIAEDSNSPTFRVNYVYRPGGDGELRPIRDNEVLRSGDHYKIIFTPDKNCYVYIFQVDSAGQIYQLFPMKSFRSVEVNNSNPVMSGKRYTLPSPLKAFKLDQQTGLERFYFIISKEQNEEITEFYNELVEARNKKVKSQIADAQDKLKTMFKRRGPSEIVDDQPVQISWEGNLFSLMGRKLADICDDCVHILEFEHR